MVACSKASITSPSLSDIFTPAEDDSTGSVVELTIPNSYVNDSAAPEETDGTVIVNNDGSVTYNLTEEMYAELLSKIQEGCEASLDGLVQRIPTIISIEHDPDFRNFTVETESEDLSFSEAASMITLFAVGGQYNAYAGESNAVIYINYTHKGTTVFVCDSSEIQRP